MRLKNMAALLAASSLMLASSPALSAPASSLSVAAPASATMTEESELLDSGFIGVALVFGLGLVAGYLLSTVLDGDDEPVSP
jgi:hypothetical protein